MRYILVSTSDQSVFIEKRNLAEIWLSQTGRTIKTTSALCNIEQLHCTCSVCHENTREDVPKTAQDIGQFDKLAQAQNTSYSTK